MRGRDRTSIEKCLHEELAVKDNSELLTRQGGMDSYLSFRLKAKLRTFLKLGFRSPCEASAATVQS